MPDTTSPPVPDTDPRDDAVALTVDYPTPRAAVLHVTGELDTLTCERFAQRAAALLDEHADLIIDPHRGDVPGLQRPRGPGPHP